MFLRNKKLSKLREFVLWGGTVRERVLCFFLSRYYRSKFRRMWLFSRVQPLYEFQRGEWYSLGFDQVPNSVPLYFARGFYASEVISDGDHVLDIGCGDGFFSSRFYAASGGKVDAIDIEETAIEAAKYENSHPSVEYVLGNAVTEEFPRDSYEVVVWDGALAHFDPADAAEVMKKIRDVLSNGGIFMGSESLGRDDHGHLQFFDTEADMVSYLKEYFPYVRVRTLDYPINSGTGFRSEVYWRCSVDKARLESFGWGGV